MKLGDLVKATDKLRGHEGFIINVGDIGLVVLVTDSFRYDSTRYLTVLINGQCVSLHPNMLELVNDVS
jgi:hypothetical protein